MPSTVIGRSIQVVGEIHGDEDLVIQGSVQGKVFLKESVVIEETGQVEADMESKSVEIAGTVTGNVVATERVHITSEGRVSGNIKAPRVNIADGALFRGTVDMER